MQKFNDNTIASKFIKNLLASTYIPTIDIIDNFVDTQSKVSNKYLDGLYIQDGFIVRYKDNKFEKTLEPYEFGEFYKGITTRYDSNILGYDSQTHYYLGQYLRAYRDLFGIDLMPFYNCYNDTYISDIQITSGDPSNSSSKFEVLKDPKDFNIKYKTVAVPIKFDTTYTIAIDCDTPYHIMPIIYGNKGFLDLDIFNNMSNCFASKIQYSQFNRPYTFKLDVAQIPQAAAINSYYINSIYQYEKFLYLLIQLPINNNSSIVVLEGSYTDLDGIKIISDNGLSEVTNKQLNEMLLSNLSLLYINDHNSYAFSNRLLEYLLLNVIDSADDIDGNIERIQNYAKSLTNKKLNNADTYKMPMTKGVWSKSLRNYLYLLAMNSSYLSNKLDINGFVDKDVEQIITRGQGV